MSYQEQVEAAERSAHLLKVVPKGFRVVYEIGDCVVLEANEPEARQPTLEELIDKLESHRWMVNFRKKADDTRVIQLVMQLQKDYRVKSVDVASTYYETLAELAAEAGTITSNLYPIAKRKGRPR